MSEEQWIDLDTVPHELLGLIQGNVQGERHGEMELVKETREGWVLRCPVCGNTVRFGKEGSLETLSRGRIRREGDHWLWGLHAWFSNPDLRIDGMQIRQPEGPLDTVS